jgi:hypothetical protein
MSSEVAQDILPGLPAFQLTFVHEDELKVSQLSAIISQAQQDNGILAVVPVLTGSGGTLTAIAFATSLNVLFIKISATEARKNSPFKKVKKARKLLNHLLTLAEVHKAIYFADALASALHLDLSIRISNATALLPAGTEDAKASEKLYNLFKDRGTAVNKAALFKALEHKPNDDPLMPQGVLRAWIAFQAARVLGDAFNSKRVLDTTRIGTTVLHLFLGLFWRTERFILGPGSAIHSCAQCRASRCVQAARH